MPKVRDNIRREPFIFTGQASLVANAQGQIQFQIPANYDYVMTGLQFVATCNSANTIPLFQMQIMKNDSSLFFDYVPSDAFSGVYIETSTTIDLRYFTSLNDWYRFRYPYKFEAKSNIIINLKNSVNTANVVQISVEGIRKYLS